MRAIRFAARFEFEIGHATFAAIRRHAGAVTDVSAERIREELTKLLTEGAARTGFELLEKRPGTLPGLRRVRMFNAGSMVSAGPVATGLNGMPFGLPRLIKHMSCDFLRDQAGALLEEFETYDEPDAWEAVRTGGDAAP